MKADHFGFTGVVLLGVVAYLIFNYAKKGLVTQNGTGIITAGVRG